MVEVAGIEPASENLSRQASTCVVRVLLNPQELPRTGSFEGESAKFRLSATDTHKDYPTIINVSNHTWAMSQET